jgi:hypothetical protein
LNIAGANIEVDYAAGGPAAAAVVGQQNGFEAKQRQPNDDQYCR